MSDLLAIFGPEDCDAELLARIAAYRPDRVTVLLAGAGADWALDESSAGEAIRSRLAGLMAAIERDNRATVVGFAGDRAQLLGWRFDRELSSAVPVAA